MAKSKHNKDDEYAAQQGRIEELRHKVEGLGGYCGFTSEACPPDIEEQFLKNVLAYETAQEQSLFDMLTRSSILLPRPDDLNDAQLTEKLWEVIRALALLHVYLECTDHLSDRELYTDLWMDLLREPIVIFTDDSTFEYHLDIVSSGSEEDISLWLKYYADKRTRKRWAKEWGSAQVPPPRRPPYDRDRLLPKPETHGGPESQTINRRQ
ncbi:MAG TPA: hypothetical protein VGK99_11010 [Acidobacteriota bacterium]|jgi:hypothetical protein